MKFQVISYDGPAAGQVYSLRRKLLRPHRVAAILKLQAQSPHLTAGELADLLGVRESTVRRDLKVVEEMRREWREMTARYSADSDAPPLLPRNVSWDRSRSRWRLKLKVAWRNGVRVL